MNLLGLGLSSSGQHEDALAVKQAELSMEQRLGGSGATLADVRKGVEILEETVLTALRVFGKAHPITQSNALELKKARVVLRAREETQPPGGA